MSDSTATLPDWSESNDGLRAMAARLAAADGPADEAGTWPEALWSIVVEAGATRWALPAPPAIRECDRVTLLERYARVAEGSLTAAFILSQHDAAVRRLRAAAERDPCSELARRDRRGPRVHDGRPLATDHLPAARVAGPGRAPRPHRGPIDSTASCPGSPPPSAPT